MKQKHERRLEDLERETESRPAVRFVIRDGAILRNFDGNLYDPHADPPGTVSRILEIVITDPPNRPPWIDPPFDPAGKTQVRH